MKTFLLILTIANPASFKDDTAILDYDLTKEDCAAMLQDWQFLDANPNAIVTCEESNK